MALPRGFLAAFLLVAAIFVGCGGSEGRAQTTGGDTAPDGRVSTPTSKGGGSCAPGDYALGRGNGRAARLRITPGPSKKPKGLIVVFHGAGGSASEGLFVFRGAWSVPGLVLVAPAALGNTWSALHQEKDRDLETVNRALAQAWRRCRI